MIDKDLLDFQLIDKLNLAKDDKSSHIYIFDLSWLFIFGIGWISNQNNKFFRLLINSTAFNF